MIEPWQVWLADLDATEGHAQAGARPCLVVSSDFHLRAISGRMATVVPITSSQRDLRSRVPIENPEGEINWVVTEQLRTIPTFRFVRDKPWWRLSSSEVDEVRRAMQFMVEF